MQRVIGVVAALALAGCTSPATTKPTGRGSSPPGVTSPAVVPAGAAAAALVRGHWSTLPNAPIPGRQDSALVWTGRDLIEFGGLSPSQVPQPDGAVYDPGTRRWHRMPDAPAPLGTTEEAHVWTGSRLFVFGGRRPPYHVITTPPCCVGGLYDPATNRWTTTSRSPLPNLAQPVAVWTGQDVVVVGPSFGADAVLHVASYDPATDAWHALDPPRIEGHDPLTFAAVATSDRLLLWSLWGRVRHTGPGATVGYSGVDVFALANDRWSDVTGRWPQHHTVDRPVFTGSQILFAPGQIWCGACSHPAPVNEHGYRADPATLAITPMTPGPLDDLGPWIVWTGQAEISLNAGGSMSGPRGRVRPGDIAFWDPDTDSWSRGTRAPTAIDPSTQPVWADGQMVALGSHGRLLSFAVR